MFIFTFTFTLTFDYFVIFAFAFIMLLILFVITFFLTFKVRFFLFIFFLNIFFYECFLFFWIIYNNQFFIFIFLPAFKIGAWFFWPLTTTFIFFYWVLWLWIRMIYRGRWRRLIHSLYREISFNLRAILWSNESILRWTKGSIFGYSSAIFEHIRYTMKFSCAYRLEYLIFKSLSPEKAL